MGPLAMVKPDKDYPLETYVNYPFGMLLICLMKYAEHKPEFGTTLVLIPEDHNEPVVVCKNGELVEGCHMSTETFRIVRDTFDNRLRNINRTQTRRKDGQIETAKENPGSEEPTGAGKHQPDSTAQD